ncbi:MAG: AAA family ATPase [Ilumatobacteraceae bacterium]
MISIGRLIHLNGPPGVGKTSLARRYLEDHPLVLVVDIDDLRTNLGQWATHEESRLLARDLAISLVDCHLGAGHDVLLPQYVGRLAFIERLEATADRHGAEFIEVVLTVDQSIAADRFRSRRGEQHALSAQHPERDVDDHSVDEIVTDALVRLADIAAARPGAKTVSAVATLDQMYQLFLATLDDRTS